jgi:MraZ protein
VEKVIEKLNQAPFTDPGADSLRRYLGARSDTAMVDKAGRIALPESMIDKLKIKKNVVLVGMLDRFQIWTPEGYEKSEAGVDALASNNWKTF